MGPAPLILRHDSAGIYRAWYEDKCVGTVLLHAQGPNPFWQWSITKVRSVLGGPASGTALSREAAMKAFRETLDVILAGEHTWAPDPPQWTPFRPVGPS